MTIKRTPQDFNVQEILAPEIEAKIQSRQGRFAVFRLVKQSLSTPEAIAQMSKSLRVAPGRIAFAGLKDKHAATTQHVTVREPAERESTLPERQQGGNWSIQRLGWIDDEIAASSILGNRFEIMVRDLTRRESEAMNEAAELLAVDRREKSGLPASIRIVNYFGDQRFGSARHGQGFLAKHLIAGDFEAALKLAIATPSRKERREQAQFRKLAAEGWGRWPELAASLPRSPERAAIEHLAKKPDDFRGAFAALPYFEQQIAVESYQSHLWNETARRLIQRDCPAEGGMIDADDPFGVLRFPAAASVPPSLADLDLPVLGRRTELAAPWGEIAAKVLREEGFSGPADLHIPGLKRPYFGEASRRLFIDARDFAIGTPQKDEMDPRGQRFRRRVVMELPRGAYATVVLRSLGQ